MESNEVILIKCAAKIWTVNENKKQLLQKFKENVSE
jgi:hypothetical protein